MDKTIRVSPGAHTLFFIIQKKMQAKFKIKPNSSYVLSKLMTDWLEKERLSEDMEKAAGYIYKLEEKPYGDHFK